MFKSETDLRLAGRKIPPFCFGSLYRTALKNQTKAKSGQPGSDSSAQDRVWLWSRYRPDDHLSFCNSECFCQTPAKSAKKFRCWWSGIAETANKNVSSRVSKTWKTSSLALWSRCCRYSRYANYTISRIECRDAASVPTRSMAGRSNTTPRDSNRRRANNLKHSCRCLTAAKTNGKAMEATTIEPDTPTMDNKYYNLPTTNTRL